MLSQPLLKALLTTRPSNQLLLHKHGTAASWAHVVLTIQVLQQQHNSFCRLGLGMIEVMLSGWTRDVQVV